MIGLRPTRAVVSLDAIARNYHAIRELVPAGCDVMPVVKADAYGHGAGPVSMRLQQAGARHFAVAVAEEGGELRREGITGEILVMGYLGEDQLPDLVRHGLVPNAHSIPLLAALAAFSRGRGIELPVHLKLDTGMTRLGVPVSELGDAIAILREARGLRLAGTFQNFASADDPGSSQTLSQLGAFAAAVRALREAGLDPGVLHVGNSAGTLLPREWPADLPGPHRARPGLALYAPFPGVFEDLEDAMAFVSVVDQVKVIPAGARVGYGGTFVAERETRVGIVPAGYADGVPRSLSGRGRVLVNGAEAPILGRVSMDLTAVDLTDLTPAPGPGAEVLFFGQHGGARLPVADTAERAGTVSWEVLCGVGPRVPRVILEGGRETCVVSRFFGSPERAR